MDTENKGVYKFNAFRLDIGERVLWRGDEHVPLPPKVLDLLCLLVEKQGAIISKQELMNAIWTDAFVEESNLTQNIYTLRRILGKSENGLDFIETVPRRGYRFAAPLNVKSKNAPIQFQPKMIDASEKRISLDETTISLSPPRVPFFSRSFFVVGVLTISFLAAGLFGWRFSTNREPSISPTAAGEILFQKLTFTGDLTYSVIAPDGKSFAYVRDNKIFWQEIGSEKIVRLNITEPGGTFGFLQFSPDGNSIYFRNQESFAVAGNVFQVSRFGGEPKLALENVWSGFGFSPDGKQAAFIRFYPSLNEYSLILKNLESGAEQILLKRQPPNSFFQAAYPAWTADGKRLATVVRSPQTWQIVVYEIDSGKTQTLETPRVTQIGQVAWLPDGANLIIVARENQKFYQLWRAAFPSGKLQRLTNDFSIYLGVSLSADGKSLLASQHTTYSHIWTALADNLGNPRQITFGNQNRDGLNGITWTPDGNIIYVSRIIGDLDLWMLRPRDDSRQRLTENAGVANLNPEATSDGKYIFFNSTRNNGSHVWRIAMDGANATQITFSETDTEHYPVVSPDNKTLYYVQKSPKASAIWRKSLVDGKSECLTELDKVVPNNFLALSPDGRFLAFQNLLDYRESETAKQTVQIGVISTAENAGAPRFFNINASRGAVSWTADSKAFDYVENTSEGAKIWRQALDSNISLQLTLNLPKDRIFNFAWSPDGKNLAMARGQELNDAMLITNFNP